MKPLKTWLAAILLILFISASPSSAVEIIRIETSPVDFGSMDGRFWLNRDPRACVLEGPIEIGDAERIASTIGSRATGFESIQCDILFLDSPGGSFYEAVKVMEFIHENMIITGVRATDVCLSACAIMWLGGAFPYGHNLDNPHADRRLWPGGKIGFHAPYPQLKPDRNYTSDEVMTAFLGAFSLSQDMFGIFYERQIPLWFAVRLMHPEISDFYYIDDIESAMLAGANVVFEGSHGRIGSHREQATACYNLSHWSKGLSAKGENDASYSGNVSHYSTLADYLSAIEDNVLPQLPHKYLWSLYYELRDAGLLPPDLGGQLEGVMDGNYGAIDRLFAASEIDGARGFFRELAGLLGPGFAYEDPGVLTHSNEVEYGTPRWRLFNGPGVVGPQDENIRDRSEICIIIESEYDATRVVGSDISQELSSQIAGRLSFWLMGLPAETLLTDLRLDR